MTRLTQPWKRNASRRRPARSRVARALAAAAAALSLAAVMAAPAAAAPATGQRTSAASVIGAALDPDQGCDAHQLARNDDGSTGLVTLPFTINFYGTPYSALYVNNNGNVTFGGPMSTYTPFQITASTPPIIAPFFADVDTRALTSGITSYGAVTYQGHQAFCVNWRRVGYYSSHTDKTDTFQLLLVSDNQFGDFDIIFNYGSIQWETGDASGGSDGLGGTPASIGFSNGDGNPAHFYQLPGSLQNGAFLDSNPSTALATHSNLNPAVPGRFQFHIASGSQITTSSTCTPYYFVSVRGSGETASSVTDQSDSKETAAVYSAMLDRYHGSKSNITYYQLPYQALSVNVLTQGLSSWNLSRDEDRFFETNLVTYLESVADGLNSLTGYLESVNRSCAAQHQTPKFILVGYSQGSLVIHQLLHDMPTADPLRSEIAFVGLIADPAAVTNSTVSINWGTALPGDYGICRVAKNVTSVDLCSTGNADIPAAFSHVTQAVCDSGDIVCDTSHTFGQWVTDWLGDVTQGKTIHTSYPTKSPSELSNMGHEIVIIAHMT